MTSDGDEAQAIPVTLDRPAMTLSGVTGVDSSIECLRLGPWQVDMQVGRGGMGEVYEAHRADGAYDLRVAVKVMKRGLDTDAVVRRFLLERRILARLVHPNIAHLLDAGVAPDGRPFLVMEFVHGQPITQYAEARSLGTREILQLMLTVCQAVQVAHGANVVHRDLKPSNVLVTHAGQVKLLDFGIARLITEEGGEQTHLAGEIAPLTPSYAAPEQLSGHAASPASDVYALGVILFELLTGRLPHDRQGVPLSQLAEQARRESTVRPSAALRQERGRLPETERLQRLKDVSSDLDLIVLKALHAEPEYRYTGAQAFADDLLAMLEHRPVRARPDSARYRATRFVRRHRLPVAAAAAVIVALSIGLTTALWQARVADRARQQADDLIGFMLGDLKQQLEGLGRLNLLDDTVAKTMTYLDASGGAHVAPEALSRRAQAFTVVSEVRFARGELENAIAAASEAVANARTLAHEAPSDASSERLARALHALGEPSIEAGQFAGTAAGNEEGLVIASRLLTAQPESRERQVLAAMLHDQHAYYQDWKSPKDPEPARNDWRACIRILEPTLQRDDALPIAFRYLARCEGALAAHLTLTRTPRDQIAQAFDTVISHGEIARQRFPEDRALLVMILYGMTNASGGFELAGQMQKADRAADHAVEIGRQLVAFEPNNVEFRRQLTQSLRRRAQLDATQQRWAPARERLDEAMPIAASVLAGTNNSVESRRLVMYLRMLRAYVAANGEHDRRAAIEETREGLTLFPDTETDGNVIEAAADLVLAQWALLRDGDPVVARAAEARALRVVEALRATKDANLLSWRPAAVDYLGGRIAQGDHALNEPNWIVDWLRAEGCRGRPEIAQICGNLR